MPIVNRFICPNGRSVTKLVTRSGVTAYVADEIPLEALIGLEKELRRKLGLPPAGDEAGIAPSPSVGEPGPKRR
jgi:hypothetical protein